MARAALRPRGRARGWPWTPFSLHRVAGGAAACVLDAVELALEKEEERGAPLAAAVASVTGRPREATPDRVRWVELSPSRRSRAALG